MKRIYIIAAIALFCAPAIAQEDEGDKGADTTRMNVGSTELIFVNHNKDIDTCSSKKKKKSEAHWAGLDFGVSMLMNSNFEDKFPTADFLRNDPAKSQTWNLNILEHKFNFGTPYVGLTTGLGFSFTSVAFKNNYLLVDTADSLYAVTDTVNNFSKNKLKASYLTVPLLLEFNTNAKASKSFYIAMGVVGGVRMSSKVKRKGETNGKKFVQKDKGRYGLNPFKLDATVRLGYSDFGVFASYSMLPLFESGKTVEAYPLTFGLSLNF